MYKALYIIGNGFDMHHGLKTSYYDFSKYLKANYKYIYSLLEENLRIPQTDKDLWNRFEENLANLDIEYILSENTDRLPNIASDDFRDRDRFVFPDIMDEYVQNLTENLFDAFQKFILDLEIPKSEIEKKLFIEKDELFLSFNYTNTLERLYKIDIKNILYIHNSAYYRYDKIILGHGTNPDKFKEVTPTAPDNLKEEELERWYDEQSDGYDYSYDEGKKNLLRYFEQSYKPTKKIIASNKSFFSKLTEVENIYVFGHSLSGIDIPYFEEIIKSVNPDVKWFVSYYNESEKETHLKTLLSLGIKQEKIKLVELEDLQVSNNQLKLALK